MPSRGPSESPCPQSVLHVSPVPLLTNLLPISIIENSLSVALVCKVDFMEDFMVESQEMVLHIIDSFITKCPLGHSSPTWSPGLPAVWCASFHFSICFSLLPLLYVPPEFYSFRLPHDGGYSIANKIPFLEIHVINAKAFCCHIKLKTIKKNQS